MVRVVVVDDHPVVRFGIKQLLGSVSDIQVVGEAGTGEAAVHLVREIKPDIVLMDLNMPGISGLVATHKLMRSNPKLKVIVLTFRDKAPFPKRLVRAGAVGYITKGASNEEILKSIRKVMAGQIYITPDIAQRMALRQVSNSAKSPFTQLSGRELQVMLMVTRAQAIKDIAKKLCLSPKTIGTYRYRLLAKLNVSNNVGLTYLAMRYGLLEEAEVLADETVSYT